MNVLLMRIGLLLFAILVFAWGSYAQTGPEQPAEEIARQLLDEETAEEQRRVLVEKQVDRAVDILHALVCDLEAGTEEETRRIPWIWRVSIEATSRNDAKQIRQLTEVSLPEIDEPLLNWQVVVLGGGIVNGISREGVWPRQQLREILEGHDRLQLRWQHAVNLSYRVAEDPDVPYPWRYDALRMIAMDDREKSIPELRSYLKPGLDDHLHMGAVSGLSDIQSPAVSKWLLSGWSFYSERNRNLALDGLLRTDKRTKVLLEAIHAGTVSVEELGEDRIEQLKNHENSDLRNRAKQLVRP